MNSVTREITVSAATSGNHGRALAWGARMFGCRCVIYMNDGVSAGREEAIAAYGAEVVRVPGSYDRTVQRSYADAERLGYFPISDEKSTDYPHISRDIIQGYAMVADEIVQQFSGGRPPTHVFVPGGGGRLAAATCGHLWERYGNRHPRVVVVEPSNSACLYHSALDDRAATLGGDGRSVMDGLVVEAASPQAWEILRAGAFAFLAIPDEAAVDAMRQAAAGVGGDPPLVIGETGIAAWAGLLAAMRDEELKQQLGLDASSRVVVIATEGATDPEVYLNLVGRIPGSGPGTGGLRMSDPAPPGPDPGDRAPGADQGRRTQTPRHGPRHRPRPGAWPGSAGSARPISTRAQRPPMETIARVASVTKTFTATAIMQLRDQGRLTLEDPLARHVPEFASARAVRGDVEGVTLRRLLTHRSGLVTESPTHGWAALDFPSREEMLARLPETGIVIPQDSAFKYSNLAFGLLGEVDLPGHRHALHGVRPHPHHRAPRPDLHRLRPHRRAAPPLLHRLQPVPLPGPPRARPLRPLSTGSRPGASCTPP